MIEVKKATAANILCIGSAWFPNKPGGLERYVYELVNHLVASNDKVELCGVGLPEMSPESSAIELINLAAPEERIWQRLWRIRSNFLHFMNQKTIQPDAINLHFALYSFPLLQLLPSGVPVTFSFHGPWALESQQEGSNQLSVWIKSWLEQLVYQRCDRFIVLSKAFGTILHERYKVPWIKIHVIPGGVDPTQFQISLSRSQAREQLGWQSDRFIVFTPRRLVQRMGIDVLLNALAEVKLEHPNIWLAIAGKGSQKDSLEQQALELGLENHVKFLGYVPEEDLKVAYQAADLTIMPSQSFEGFGLVLLESLASGTPVLCTPVGGMPEVLMNFSPELITSSADAKAIATKLKALLSGEISLPDRDICREYATTNFNWTKIAERVRRVLLLPLNKSIDVGLNSSNL
ncbi:glycosyltransferase family 4 protein [Synechocystis sp. PCC 7509]|uniref:glycosyltransferase family 4 protein n=1 Tax=Synechocystis sp. PCC 7509 TaxID=927677 RepID=UPI0002ABADAB|nr:glycosyltransferase family 4 protein [Synechocystis sp. PCC 7509]